MIFLNSIELQHFRNYPEFHGEFSPQVNIFYGQNAQGKTNLLEAISLLCFGKSFRTKKDAELIEWQIDKTNSTYINELADQGQREAFGVLTRQFEYVWYGEFLIDGQVYKNINSSFQDFNKRVA